MSEQIIQRTYDSLLDPYTEAVLNSIDEYWAGRSYADVLKEMPEPMYVPTDDERYVKLVEIAPDSEDGDEHDTTHDIALELPYLNDYSPRHYIRARTLQLANPNYSVWLMPNNSLRSKTFKFTNEEKARLTQGDIRPLGEIHVRAFENNPHRIGSLAVTGYAQGGLTALAIAGVKSNIEVSNVNADELPSKKGRTTTQLIKDLDKSKRDMEPKSEDLSKPVLSEAMPPINLSRDIAEFLCNSKSIESRIMRKAMAGSADNLIEAAVGNGVEVKLGYIAGSRLFDIKSISPHLLGSPLLSIVQYGGRHFKHMQHTGDNIKLHTLMATDGLHLH